jgi:hypothetical protein
VVAAADVVRRDREAGERSAAERNATITAADDSDTAGERVESSEAPSG